MERTEQFKQTFERNAKAMSMRPSLGLGTAVTKVTMGDGPTCDVQDGNWKLADEHSPLRDDFARALDVRREVRVAAPKR